MNSSRYLALLRGINVGRGNRLSMNDLRDLVAGRGYGDVGTVLASGNVAFTAPAGADSAVMAAEIEKALTEVHGLRVRVTVVGAADLAAIIGEAPLAEWATDPSRLLVGFPRVPGALARLRPLVAQDWSPAALSVKSGAVWLWCPNGVLADNLATEVGKAMGEDLTTRNWATVLKLKALLAQKG